MPDNGNGKDVTADALKDAKAEKREVLLQMARFIQALEPKKKRIEKILEEVTVITEDLIKTNGNGVCRK